MKDNQPQRCVRCGNDFEWHEPTTSGDGQVVYAAGHDFVPAAETQTETYCPDCGHPRGGKRSGEMCMYPFVEGGPCTHRCTFAETEQPEQTEQPAAVHQPPVAESEPATSELPERIWVDPNRTDGGYCTWGILNREGRIEYVRAGPSTADAETPESELARLRDNLCTPYTEGDCTQCDERMERIKALQESITAPSPDAEARARNLRSRLIQIAGAIVMHTGFVSPYAEDHSKATPRSIIKTAEKQEERLKDWAYELRQIADAIPAALSTRPEAGLVERIEKLRRPPTAQFNVRFIDHIQGTNSAEWECGNCKGKWASPSNLECPHCHDNASPSKVTEADTIYNQAIRDAVAAIRQVRSPEPAELNSR